MARSAGRIQTAVRNMSTQALPKLRHFTATAVSYIGSVAESMPGMTEALKSAVGTLLPDVMEMLLTLPAAFLSGISVSLDGLADLAGSMISALIRGIGQALPALVRAAADACSAMLAAFTDTARIRAFGESVMHDLTNALSSADFRKAAEQLGDALLGAAGNIRQILSGITGYLSGIDLSHIGQQLQDGIRVALQGIEAVLLGSEHVSEPAWRAIGAKLNQFIREGFAGAGTWLRQLILGDSLEGGTWRDAGSRIAGWIRSGLTLGRDFLTGLILGDADNQAAFADLGVRIISGIRSGLDTGAGMLRQVLLEGTEEGTWEAAGRQMAAYLRAGITSLGSLLKEAVGSPEELNLQALGEQIGNGLRAGLETLRGFLAELIMSGADGTRSWLELGGQIGLAIRSGISEAGNFLSGLILGGESGNSWTDTGKRIAEQIREGFLFKAGLLESLIFGTETDWHARGKQTAALIRNGFEAAGNFLLEVLGLNGTEDWTARGHMIWQRIQAGFQDAGQFLEGLLLGDASGGSWVSAGSRIWTAVRQGLSEAEGYLMTCLFGRAGEPDWRALGARAADGLSAGLEGLRGLLSQLLLPEMEAGGSWADIGRTLFEGILDGMKRAADAAGSFLTGLLLGESGDWEMAFQSAGSALWQMLREGFVTAMTGLGSLAGLIAESILRFDWLPAGGEIGIGLVRGILESFTALGSGIEGFLQEVFRGVKYAVLSWFGIEIDDMTRQMESRVFTLDGSRITGEALNSLIGSSSATIREQAEAWAMLVQAGFEEQANTLSFSPAAVALATRLETDMLGEQERILAAAALIASGFGDAILMQDFGLYADGRAMMDELYQGLEDGADVTREMCMQLGIEVPETIAEALGDGPWNMTGEAMTEGMNRALEQVNAEAEALAAAYGRDTGNAYIEEVNAALESAVLSSDGLSSALLEAAGDAAQAGGDTIGRQVMDAAGAAVRENRDVLSREAALAAEPAAFETARENAGEAGASIGGAIAPEITARLADVEGAVAQLVDAIGAGFFPVGDRMAEGMHGAMARVLEEMDSGAEMIQARLNALDLQFSASMEPLGTVLGAGAGGTVSVDMRRTDIPDGALLADSLTGGFGKLSGMLTAILETELAALAGVLDAGCLALLQGAAEYAGQMQTLHAELSEQIISVTETLSGTLRDLFSAFHAEMTSQMRTFVSELTAEYAPVQERLREITERMSSDVRAVFMDFSSALTMQMQALTDMLQSVFSVLPSALSAIMQSAMSAVQAAIEAGGSMAAAAASSAAAGIISAMQAHAGYGQGYGIGQNLMEGVAGGIRGMAGQLASAAASAVSKAVTVMRQTLKIHSPSKVTMEIGENMDAGVALGIAGGQMIEAAGASVRAAALKMADAAYIEMPEREMTVTARTAPEMVKAGDGEETDREARSIALAEQVAVILADRLIESGALCGDFYLDSTKVGQQVAGPVSRCISDRSRSTVRGRSASGILT
ncbi:MAG: hypothetical protein IJ242_02145 [Clostridia bacterium]|nr:hypothetical protein [Clostridia bacterium]